MRRRSLLAAWGGASAMARAAPLTLRFPGPRDAFDRRNVAIEELVRLLFDAAGQPVVLQKVPGLSQPRQIYELRDGHVDLALAASSQEDLPGIQLLRQPLRRGLLGLRLLVATPEMAPRLAEVRSIEELRRWTMGYGADWADLNAMRTLELKVVTASTYAGLFRMLELGRFDWLHRGVNEIWGEMDQPGLVGRLVVVPRVALYYPLDDYFCVSDQRPDLLRLLRIGFARMLRDGRYAAWFQRHHGDSLRRAQMAKRLVLHLDGYGVPVGTPMHSFDVLQLAATRAELRVP
ncbi:MAG: hypothetical protein J0L58_14245 [Burkholderiales bacterium]|uniref:hypothetical protein n=1 Tax=Inhella sp. TaxID=1921806 RepID=UPI001AC6604D|nr:hypothetical protein [Burkholderiales bacterium]